MDLRYRIGIESLGSTTSIAALVAEHAYFAAAVVDNDKKRTSQEKLALLGY